MSWMVPRLHTYKKLCYLIARPPFHFLTCPFGSDHFFAQYQSENPEEPGKKYNDVSRCFGEDKNIL